jgi:hypothetical protein
MRFHSFWMAVCFVGACFAPASAQDAEPNMLDRCQTAPQTDNQAPQTTSQARALRVR